MPSITIILLSILGVLYSCIFFRDTYKHRAELAKAKIFISAFSGFIANFLDTLGIGSFAVLTVLLRFFKLVPDRIIPGTLNVSCFLPVMTEALIFITVIEVETVTLLSMLLAAMLGAYIGAGFVAKFTESKVQLYMGIALIIVGGIILTGLLGIVPLGGTAVGLYGIKFIIAIIGNFIFGALMTVGVGLFGPCMALVYLLGMSPRVAFPIMMGSCAFLQSASSYKFIKENAYDRKSSLFIAVGGCIGVLIAAFIVRSLPLEILKWVVVCVVIYTGVSFIRAFCKGRNKTASKVYIDEE